MKVFALAMMVAVSAAAATTFVSPGSGAQAIGVLPIEVTTTVADVDRVDFFIDGALTGVARKAPFRILHDFGTNLAPHQISARVYSNGYRTVESAKVLTSGLTAADTINVDLVEVPMRVRASRPLRPADLRLTENGVEQTIRDVRADRGPARFVFVIDRSLSMTGGKLEAALRAVGDARSRLRRGDRAEIVLFNHIVSPPLAIGPIDVTPSGGTSLRDAVASTASSDRTYAIAITDGGDRNSALSDEEALERISGTKTVVDAIILGRRSAFLDRAAQETGGVAFEASANTIARELQRILDDINSRYTLVYQSSNHDRGWRSIAIAPRVRGVEILNARKGYFAR